MGEAEILLNKYLNTTMDFIQKWQKLSDLKNRRLFQPRFLFSC